MTSSSIEQTQKAKAAPRWADLSDDEDVVIVRKSRDVKPVVKTDSTLAQPRTGSSDGGSYVVHDEKAEIRKKAELGRAMELVEKLRKRFPTKNAYPKRGLRLH